MAPQIQSPLLPPGSLVLVTAANGFIASHIVDQLLLYGYAVRGTVRSLARSSWMKPLFQKRHPNGSLDIVEVPDISVPGCYDDAMKGASAVIHTAGSTSMSGDPNVVQESIAANLNALEAAAKANKNGEKIRRFVLTSSSWAVTYPKPNTPRELTYDTYDTSAEEALADPNTPKEAVGLMVYVVSKTKGEQESWKWVREHPDCGFVLNSVMPSTCIGPVLAPTEQPYPTTAGFLRSLWEGKNAELFDWLEPHWYVDVRDAARLHVAGAVLDGVEGQRDFGFAETFTWQRVAHALEKEMGKKVPIMPKDKGEEMSRVPQERSVNMLKGLGLKGWENFEESVALNIRSFYPKE
ncbi:NAD(P)-binding protein [Trematosphaeria pertusa]|uniref:NAD(P)-binding protein n=1 Tax=Trematosphaeria pertusa TaxID=390896 RepID=A0A6A6ICA3_9PLEO|nr:NAD(P)-binding protein [Trematosphaeria pertusa]KAF2247698.1 NAD(P)-binding protein [Trematosphaeria pertusa]